MSVVELVRTFPPLFLVLIGITGNFERTWVLILTLPSHLWTWLAGQFPGFTEQSIQVAAAEILPAQEDGFNLLGVADIFERIAANENHGGRLSLFYAAEPVVKAHELRRYERGAAQHIRGRDAGL